MATYPSQILVKADVINEVDVYDQNDHNILKGEIISLQSTIGTNPHGQRPNLAARLNAMLNPSGYLISSAGVPQPTSPGMLWYDTTAGLLKFIKTDNTTQSVGGSLSNVIFNSAIEQTSYSDWAFLSNQPDLNGTVPSGLPYNYWVNTINEVGWQNVREPIKWAKISGVNTLKANLHWWCDNNGGRDAQISFGIGATTSVSGASSATTVTNTTLSIDVSGLNIGTIYEILLKMKASASGGNRGYLSNHLVYGE